MSEPLSDEERWFPARRVCVLGEGTSNLFHSHDYRVERLTKTLIVVKHKQSVLRFRRDGMQRSVPYSPWGGHRVGTACLKKESVF